MKQKKCKNCKGKGYVPVFFEMASRARGIEECPVCKGAGKVESEGVIRMSEREELKGEEIRTDNTETLKNALERIMELEKENAELKARLNAINRLTPELEECAKLKKRQLTEAKEIIEALYDIIPASMADYAKEPMERARNFFLKECGNA